uniref:CHAT domain-containing protein n=1 Tax=Bionectria ochroleuca TaxID=29856 RepID=A0A8H7N4I0_BIOOC
MRYLNEAIEIDKNVIRQVKLRKYGWMNDKQRVFTQYAIRLLKRYRVQKNAADLTNAERICHHALKAEPDGVNLSFALCALGDVFYQRHLDGQSPDALRTASSAYRDGFSKENASPQHRIQCGMGRLKTLCLMGRWEDGYEASSKTLTLVQQMMARSLENAEKQYLLGQCVGFASDAASVALNAGKGPEIALQFLEQGRGLLASSIEDSQIDVTSLQASYPDLAEKFTSIREQLQDSATPRIDPKTRHNFKNHEEARSVQRHKLGEDLDRLVDEIRTKPGFETFLEAPTVLEMQAAAADGAIVVLNVNNYRSDAIIVEKDRVHALPLPMLSKEEVVERARGGTIALASTETLEWLWETVASPVLDCLGITRSLGQDESQWPRIWWVATGIMSSFPIHAAGWHVASSDLGHTVLDRVVSSYSSSIKSIIHSKRRPAFNYQKLGDQSQALLVAVPQAPGCSSLPSAAKEHEVLQKLFNTINWKVHAAENTKDGVMSRLRSSQVFHFAGHGTVDPLNPSRSFLFLEDWKKDPFTVAELLELNLQQGMPFLAYLSACRTGQIRDEESLDESVHLISAFQLAGFRHVIGTLWEVNDDICVYMANYAYQAMWNGRFTDRSVCLGLHTAMRKLRDEWRSRVASSGQRGKIRVSSKLVHSAGSQMNRSQNSKEGRDMLSCDEEEKLFWVPFVHFGV